VFSLCCEDEKKKQFLKILGKPREELCVRKERKKSIYLSSHRCVTCLELDLFRQSGRRCFSVLQLSFCVGDGSSTKPPHHPITGWVDENDIVVQRQGGREKED
jgi:hypothetical protein